MDGWIGLSGCGKWMESGCGLSGCGCGKWRGSGSHICIDGISRNYSDNEEITLTDSV